MCSIVWFPRCTEISYWKSVSPFFRTKMHICIHLMFCWFVGFFFRLVCVSVCVRIGFSLFVFCAFGFCPLLFSWYMVTVQHFKTQKFSRLLSVVWLLDYGLGVFIMLCIFPFSLRLLFLLYVWSYLPRSLKNFVMFAMHVSGISNRICICNALDKIHISFGVAHFESFQPHNDGSIYHT